MYLSVCFLGCGAGLRKGDQLTDTATPQSGAPTPGAEASATLRGGEVHERHGVPYRTAFETTLDLRTTTEQVRGQLRNWIKSKQLDVERFDAEETSLGEGAVLLYLATNVTKGWQLRERRDRGITWVSTIAVTRGQRETTWVSMNIEAVAPTGGVPSAAPPRLVRLLLDALDAFDGEAPLRSKPTLVSAQNVDALLEDVICNDRRLPVVVAAPPYDVEFESWRRMVEEVTADLPGLASTYVLNPAAAPAFNNAIGSTHGIGPGAIRTYLPEVDPAVEQDAVRHRVLGRRRVESEPRRARRVLAALPRQLAASSLPPGAARGLNLSMRDFTRGIAVQALSDQDTARLQAEIKLLNELLETADDSERQLKVRNDELQNQVLDLASELEVARDESEILSSTVRALRHRLLEADRYDEAYTPPEELVPLPKSFSDLLHRIDELAPYVIFTGDRDVCLDLDDHTASSTWAQIAWQALLALRDYAEAKGKRAFEGDFKTWCGDSSTLGRVVPPGKVARDESKTVRTTPKYASARTFPVPRQVDPSGRSFMGAHIRLGQTATVSPRLYFQEVPADAVIYVGYIGRHLPNTLTS